MSHGRELFIAGSPDDLAREAARRFIEFMLAPATERQLAGEPGRHAPIVTLPQEGDLAIPDPLLVDPVRVSEAADDAVRRFTAARQGAAGPVK